MTKVFFVFKSFCLFHVFDLSWGHTFSLRKGVKPENQNTDLFQTEPSKDFNKIHICGKFLMRVEMCQFSKPVLVSLEKTDCLTTFRPVIRILASEKAKQNKSGNQDKICRWLSYKVQIWFARNVLPQLFPSSYRSSLCYHAQK